MKKTYLPKGWIPYYHRIRMDEERIIRRNRRIGKVVLGLAIVYFITMIAIAIIKGRFPCI